MVTPKGSVLSSQIATFYRKADGAHKHHYWLETQSQGSFTPLRVLTGFTSHGSSGDPLNPEPCAYIFKLQAIHVYLLTVPLWAQPGSWDLRKKEAQSCPSIGRIRNHDHTDYTPSFMPRLSCNCYPES